MTGQGGIEKLHDLVNIADKETDEAVRGKQIILYDLGRKRSKGLQVKRSLTDHKLGMSILVVM